MSDETKLTEALVMQSEGASRPLTKQEKNFIKQKSKDNPELKPRMAELAGMKADAKSITGKDRYRTYLHNKFKTTEVPKTFLDKQVDAAAKVAKSSAATVLLTGITLASGVIPASKKLIDVLRKKTQDDAKINELDTAQTEVDDSYRLKKIYKEIV